MRMNKRVKTKGVPSKKNVNNLKKEKEGNERLKEKVTMIDVSSKEETLRTAEAQGKIWLSAPILKLILENKIPKGNVLAVAKIAGLQAAKKTAELLPLCHPLRLTSIDVDITPQQNESALLITSKVKAFERTGVEMEALTAVAVACLAIYDMVKSLDKKMVIGQIHLLSKTGGQSGDFTWA